MKGTWTTICALFLGLLVTVAAGAGEERPEGFDGELRAFLTELSVVADYDAARLAAVRSQVEALTPAELETLRSALLGVPNWQRVPQVLAALEEARGRERQRAAARRALAGRRLSPIDGGEPFREDLLIFVGQLRLFSPLSDNPDFDAVLDRLEGRIAALPAEGLPALERMWRRNAPAWKARLASDLSGGGPPTTSASEKLIFSACNMGCSAVDFECLAEEIGCDIEQVGNEITRIANLVADAVSGFFMDVEGVFEEIAGVLTDIGDFFIGLFAEVEAAIVGLFEDFPTDVNGALALLGVEPEEIESFVETVAGSVPILDLPCPSIDTDIPGFGVVGSPQAEYVCQRGVDWIAALLYDLVPDDVLDIPLKIPATIVYYPINYFCLCLAAQSEISFRQAQADHRAFVAERLDATLRSRATQISVDAAAATAAVGQAQVGALDASVGALQGGLDDLDLDVSAVEAKLDVDLDATVASRASQSSLDDLQGDVDAVEVKLDVQGEKTAELSDAQQLQLDFLEAFRELELRLDIEAALTENEAVASLELPLASSGFLERVREIVVETIQMNLDAGEGVGQAGRELDRGDDDLAGGDFDAAYTHYRKAYQNAIK